MLALEIFIKKNFGIDITESKTLENKKDGNYIYTSINVESKKAKTKT